MLCLRNYSLPSFLLSQVFSLKAFKSWAALEFTTWPPVSAVPKLVRTVFVDSRRVKGKEALLFGSYVDLALNTSLHQLLSEKPSGLHTGLLSGEEEDTLLQTPSSCARVPRHGHCHPHLNDIHLPTNVSNSSPKITRTCNCTETQLEHTRHGQTALLPPASRVALARPRGLQPVLWFSHVRGASVSCSLETCWENRGCRGRSGKHKSKIL